MSDETQNESWTQPGATAAPGSTPPPAGYCQDCGRALTPETLRNVGASLFCEPCLTARVTPPQPIAGDASPVLAGLLGIIPGVGAMYNGQYAKGFVHLAVSAVLFSLHDGHGVIGLLCFGWFCYQILDAYQTAKSRRDGMPLPNPLGLNDIGERMGFGRTWGPAPNPNPAQPPVTPPPAASYSTPWQAPRTDWVGYVPPTAFAGTAPAPPVDPAAAAAAQQAPAWGHAPYTQTYTGGVPPAAPTYAAVPPATPLAPLEPLPPTHHLPIGAFWLIGLGVLILLANLVPDWHLGGRWLLPILLAGLGTWIFTRRLRNSTLRGAYGLRWPVMLVVLAVLFALQSAEWLTLGQTWPVLFIAFGALLLIERLMAPPAVVYDPVAATMPATSPASEAEAERARAAWAAGGPANDPEPREPATEQYPGKDGQ